MQRKNTSRLISMLTLMLFAAAVFAAQAPAAPKDKNGNGIPDAWEKANGISVKKDQGNRDADADGSRNRCEYQAKTDPNNADSDADGIVDGDEDTDADGATDRAESNLRSNCGRANTHLRIRRATVESFTDGTLTLTVRGGGTVAAVTSDKLRCTYKPAAKKKSGKKLTKSAATAKRCTTADLVSGAKVHKARTKSSKFVEITLIK